MKRQVRAKQDSWISLLGIKPVLKIVAEHADKKRLNQNVYDYFDDEEALDDLDANDLTEDEVSELTSRAQYDEFLKQLQ